MRDAFVSLPKRIRVSRFPISVSAVRLDDIEQCVVYFFAAPPSALIFVAVADKANPSNSQKLHTALLLLHVCAVNKIVDYLCNAVLDFGVAFSGTVDT